VGWGAGEGCSGVGFGRVGSDASAAERIFDIGGLGFPLHPSFSHTLPLSFLPFLTLPFTFSSPYLPSPSPPFPLLPSPWSGGSGVLPPENFEILHCCRWVLEHFRSKKCGFWLKVLAWENIECPCDWPLEEIWDMFCTFFLSFLKDSQRKRRLAL